MKRLVQKVVLPDVPKVELCFAYGSGVFPQQAGAIPSDKMIDLVFVVRDAVSWHSENIRTFASAGLDEYPFYLHTGRLAANFQQRGDSKMMYFPYVPFPRVVCGERRIFKYGVISLADFLDDLCQWNQLYVAGRLHKPVAMCTEVTDEIRRALDANLRAALAGGLLLLPPGSTCTSVSDATLFNVISSISYSGDIRMRMAEDPHKVSNIVRNNLTHFRALYRPVLEQFEQQRLVDVLDDQTVVRVGSDEQLQAHIPIPVDSFAEAVHKSSRSQAVKGVLSAGLVKSLRYAGEKITKRFQ